jgi:lysozyme
VSPPAGCVPLIDVSSAQGIVDWGRVAAAGVRAVYVEHGVGNDPPNALAASQVTGARGAGLLVGRYDFLYPIGLPGEDRDASGQAARHAAIDLGPYDLPAVIDLEWPQPGDWGKWGCSGEQIVAWVRSYAAARPEVGRCYVSPGYASSLGHPDLSPLDLWVAHWGVETPDVPEPWTDWAAWQHSATGHVDGIVGSVDLSWLRM